VKNLLATALPSLRVFEQSLRRLLCLLLFTLLPGWAAAQAAGIEVPRLQIAMQGIDPPQSYRVLCYHDVRDNVRETFKVWPEATAVDTRDLIAQLSWLDQNGYHPVSLQQIIDARAGKKPLPEKAILLTFHVHQGVSYAEAIWLPCADRHRR
jgi:biofilm PGA synthesis lipoprotein PgaB